MWTTLGSEAILAVRTYAFLGKKQVIAIFLGVLLLGETAFLLFVSIKAVHQTPLLIGDRGPCTASDAPGQHVVSGFWMAPVLFDLICTIMTLYKVKFAFTLRLVGVKSQLVRVFLREGLLYFLAVAFINILNAVFMFQPNANLQNINCFLALVLSQVLCCRLVLNLRASDNEKTTDYSIPSEANQGFSAQPSRQTQSGGINIPLNRFKNGPYGDDIYNGVKVQVDVERDGDTISNPKM
ncbi:hypothetical protein MPER_04933 [Moniliophthora perniciosa FA553]|nr:hypothetical protein MPER_04933 [Moniliophthora perniciosa FA553]